MHTCIWLCNVDTTTIKVYNDINRCLAYISLYMDACSGQWPKQSVYITTEQTVTCLHHTRVPSLGLLF